MSSRSSGRSIKHMATGARSAAVLLLAAIAVFAASAAAQRLVISQTNPVCIVGAGVAGIGAARSLKAAGIPVVILEARGRPGGRVWSAQVLGKGASGTEPVTLDLGAGWLEGDGTGNPIYNIVRPYFGQTVVSNFDSGESYYTTGGEVLEPTADWEEFESVDLKAQQDSAADEDPDPSLLTLIQRATAADTAQEKLRRQWQATMQVANEYAADPAQLSGTQWDSTPRLPGEQRLWKNGYFNVFRPMLAGLNISYATVVSSVSVGGASTFISVGTNKGMYRCSRVVVTVPLGVLKANKIAFSPALPAAKRASITKLGMGNFNKIALRFPPSALNILPPATANFFNFVPRTFTATNIKNGVYDFVNMRYVRPEMQSPVIVGIVAGQYAKSLESVALSTIVAQVMTQLRAEWPDLPNPIATAMTKWSTDPYSLGAYSYMAPGSSSADYTEIGRPIYTAAGVPWLQLAGEAAGSWPYPSQVHGAFTAGKKAGDLIVATRTKF